MTNLLYTCPTNSFTVITRQKTVYREVRRVQRSLDINDSLNISVCLGSNPKHEHYYDNRQNGAIPICNSNIYSGDANTRGRDYCIDPDPQNAVLNT